MTPTRARFGALPVLLLAYAALVALFLAQAASHDSPWIFFDELDYAWNSRAIAHLATLAGAKPWRFENLYTFLIAPAWWFGVGGGYALAKAIGAVAMAAAIFPAYGLARALSASRPAAIFAAAATVTVPALSYTSTLMTETLAYPYATLCFFLFVKWFSVRGRWWTAGVVAAALVAPLVRRELAVIPAAFAAAALALFAVPWLGRSWRRWAAALAAAAVALAMLAWLLTRASVTWDTALRDPVGMLTAGRSALAGVVVGVAVLPAVAGLAALVRPRDEAVTPARRGFTYVAVASTLGFLLYTASKARYFGLLSHPVEERNLIYVVPFLFAGTALWLTRLRTYPAAAVAAGSLVLWLVLTVPIHVAPVVPESDAPSFEIFRLLGWGEGTLHVLLAVAAVVCVLVVVGMRRAGAVAAVAACGLILAWTLTSEIYASQRSADYARILVAPLPRPLDWVDRATGTQSTLYVGQEIRQPTDIWLLAFWNRSIVRMRSIDDTPPKVGSSTGDILPIAVRPNGALPAPTGIQFVVADQGIQGVGSTIATAARWRVHRKTRLHAAARGIYTDGWMGERSTYRVFDGTPSRIHVGLSRTAWCARDVPGKATIRVDGALRGSMVLHACRGYGVDVPAPRPPFTVSTSITPTFVPAQLNPTSPDTRHLGAVVEYSDVQ